MMKNSYQIMFPVNIIPFGLIHVHIKKIELKCNTALITKSPLINTNIGKSLFENLQTKLA